VNDSEKQIIEKFGKYFEPNEVKVRTISQWKDIFSNELSYVFSTKPYGVDFKWLYRARKIDKGDELFDHTKKLWAPPRKKVSDTGRCNVKNQSMLYLSSHVTTVLFEIKPSETEKLLVMEYQSLGEIGPLNIIGVRDIIQINDSFNALFKNHFENSTDESTLTDDFLSIIFKSKTQFELGYNSYNLTNAIAQIFLHNQKGLDKNMPMPPKSIGIIYPSVETVKVLGANLVVNPLNAKSKLKPKKCYCYDILRKHDEHHYEIKLTHETSKIYDSGQMKWNLLFDQKVEYITDL
jgi:hypothetical protein